MDTNSIKQEEVKLDKETEHAYWCSSAFRVLPRELLALSTSDFGECRLIVGSEIIFDHVRFRDCHINNRGGSPTTVLIFGFQETPDVVFCLLPEELVILDTIPTMVGESTSISLGFVPRPELECDGGVSYANPITAVQLAEAVSVNGPIKLTLCGASQGLLTFFTDLQTWKRQKEEQNAAASVAQAEAVASKRHVPIRRIVNPSDATSMSGSLPILRPRGMDIDSTFLQRRTVVVRCDDDPLKCHMRQLSQETMKDEDSNPPDHEEKPVELVSPVPVMPTSIQTARMPGLESLVNAASNFAPSPLITPPLFSRPPCVKTETSTVNTVPAQPVPKKATSQFFSQFSGITPGLSTPELDEEAVAVLHGAMMKRRKSNSEKPIIPFVTAPVETTSSLGQTQAVQNPTRAAGTERKAGRFKIPPEQRHKRSYSQGGHCSGSHTPSQSGANGGLSSFCGTQDGVQGLHQCKWDGCNLTFGVLSVLTTHLQSHTLASSDFVCRWDGCPRQGKPFSNHSGLFRHLRYHTGDKPCKCPVEGCGFSSVDNGELNRHIKLVHRG